MLGPRKVVRKSDAQVAMVRSTIKLSAVDEVCVFLMDSGLRMEMHDFAFGKIKWKFTDGVPFVK